MRKNRMWISPIHQFYIVNPLIFLEQDALNKLWFNRNCRDARQMWGVKSDKIKGKNEK